MAGGLGARAGGVDAGGGTGAVGAGLAAFAGGLPKAADIPPSKGLANPAASKALPKISPAKGLSSPASGAETGAEFADGAGAGAGAGANGDAGATGVGGVAAAAGYSDTAAGTPPGSVGGFTRNSCAHLLQRPRFPRNCSGIFMLTPQLGHWILSMAAVLSSRAAGFERPNPCAGSSLRAGLRFPHARAMMLLPFAWTLQVFSNLAEWGWE